MLEIKCSTCGHLKVFHHKANSECSKEEKYGCHFTIKTDKKEYIECECRESYSKD